MSACMRTAIYIFVWTVLPNLSCMTSIKATTRKQFLVTFSQKNVLQMYKKCNECKETTVKINACANARLIIHIIEGQTRR